MLHAEQHKVSMYPSGCEEKFSADKRWDDAGDGGWSLRDVDDEEDEEDDVDAVKVNGLDQDDEDEEMAV